MRKKLSTIQRPEKKVFFVLLALIMVLCITYGYFLNMTIVRAVERERTLELGSSMDARVSELEFQYIAMQNSIDIAAAYNRNFVEIASSIYISRADDVPSFSLLLSGDTR